MGELKSWIFHRGDTFISYIIRNTQVRVKIPFNISKNPLSDTWSFINLVELH